MHCECERQFGLKNVQQQINMTLPISKNGTHSKQREMFTLITGSKFCHCRSCFFCVCYMGEGRSEKGRGGRKVERKGQQHGPMEINYKSSCTCSGVTSGPASSLQKGKTGGRTRTIYYFGKATLSNVDLYLQSLSQIGPNMFALYQNPLFPVVVFLYP